MFHVSPDQIIVLGFLALIAWAACNDAVEFKIPNSVSIGIVALYPLYAATAAAPVAWVQGLAVAIVIFAIGLGLFAGGIAGGGDVKMLSAVALWAGPKMIFPMLLVMSLTGGAMALLFLAAGWLGRRRAAAGIDVSLTAAAYAAPARLPYGVAIAAGASLVGLRLVSG